MSPARKDPATTADYRAMQSEAEFQALVLVLAQANNWKVYHTRTSIGSDEGWPDLALVHEGWRWTLFVELKREGGRVTPAQAEWLRVLKAAGNDARLWRPSDWPEIEDVLTGRAYGSAAVSEDGSFQGGHDDDWRAR